MRLPDWRSRLGAYIETVRHRPFEYAHHDCALFAAGAVEAMTGEDLAAEYRGRYADLRSGLRLARKSHIAIAEARFEEIHPSLAQVGDIAVVAVPDDALGIVQGSRIFVVGETGLMTVDLLAAKRAFRV